jgi:hypothetical protein
MGESWREQRLGIPVDRGGLRREEYRPTSAEESAKVHQTDTARKS